MNILYVLYCLCSHGWWCYKHSEAEFCWWRRLFFAQWWLPVWGKWTRSFTKPRQSCAIHRRRPLLAARGPGQLCLLSRRMVDRSLQLNELIKIRYSNLSCRQRQTYTEMETISLPDGDRREIGKDAYYQTFTLEIDFTRGRAIRVHSCRSCPIPFCMFVSSNAFIVCWSISLQSVLELT